MESGPPKRAAKPDPKTEPAATPQATESEQTRETPDRGAPDNTVELARAYGGREVVAVALVVVIGVFALTVVAIRDATAIAAAMGSVTTLIGTLVGSYFGFQAGNQGRQQEAAAAQVANKNAMTAAAFVPPDDVNQFLATVAQTEANSTVYGNPDFE